MSKENSQPTEKYDSLFSLFIRVFWMLFGNAILIFAAISISQHKGEMFHTADIVFWGTAVTLIFVRYVDIKFYKGLTTEGQPATMSHWRKYVILLLIFSTLIWVLAHIINYIVVNK